MSTGKRLAKRSIIGTRVCAPGQDGKYYSGAICAVKTPQAAESPGQKSGVTPKTLYTVRFDITGGSPPSPKEYADRDLIGPGFGSVTGARLVPGQKVYLTYNGREIHAEVTEHRQHLDEVDVVIAPNGQEGTMSLTKRIDEIRLLESRKSARLADQDTDFARLADMAGDRKRASSHSIDVPHVMASRKRRPSSNNDSERTYSGWGERVLCGREGCRTNERGDCMDECAAALVLMSLSCSPHSPHNPPPLHCQYNYGSWGSRGGGGGGMIAGSPGVGGMSNSSSSSGASWRSGTPSPPLSEEGVPTRSSPCPATSHPSHNQPHYPYNASGSSSSSTPGSTTLDEGIVPDYIEEQHPRKKIRAKVNHPDPIETEPGACATFESEQANAAVVFKCTWPGCLEIKATVPLIEEHVRQSHLGPKKSKGCDSEDDMSVHEEEFYYQEVAVDHMSSPPTMSHRDMARPPHEDPEYQKQLRLETTPAASNYIENVMVGVREPSNTFTISQSPGTPNKHIKLSPRPLQACHQQNMTASTGKPSSPRRTRSDVKKCRKIYGMDSRDLWCTQCRWKKACTRFCSE